MYKMLVGAGLIAILITIMATASTYMNSHLATDMHDEIDATTDIGYRANQTMLNISKGYDSQVESVTMAAWIIVITLPLAAIVVLKKILP